MSGNTIVEAVTVTPEVTWVRYSDGTTGELQLGGAARTVGALRQLLAQLPADTPLLVDGYELGFTPASVQIVELQQLSGMPDYAGSYLSPDDANAEVAGGGDSGWALAVPRDPAPARVGDAVYAIVFRRRT